MTIKKRLAQSNIAMLVIPLLTAAVLLLLGLGAALLLLRENMPSVHTVAYPSGSARLAASIPASLAAFSAISVVMLGSESVICSRTVPRTREKCCSTQPMQLRRSRPGWRRHPYRRW